MSGIIATGVQLSQYLIMWLLLFLDLLDFTVFFSIIRNKQNGNSQIYKNKI